MVAWARPEPALGYDDARLYIARVNHVLTICLSSLIIMKTTSDRNKSVDKLEFQTCAPLLKSNKKDDTNNTESVLSDDSNT